MLKGQRFGHQQVLNLSVCLQSPNDNVFARQRPSPPHDSRYQVESVLSKRAAIPTRPISKVAIETLFCSASDLLHGQAETIGEVHARSQSRGHIIG